MNVDVVVDPNKSLIGCGSILRDAKGNFISAHVAPIQISLPSNEAKAMSMREALSWLKHMQLPRVIIEMDSQMVYKALKSTSLYASPFAMLIADCQKLVSSMVNLKLSFVKRYVNSVAHSVARASCSMSGPTIWDVIAPSFLTPTFLSDHQ